jgi:putative Mn2+ efflux pump MntP
MEMPFFTTFFIAVGLAMDAFAVSLGIGTNGQARSVRPVFRLAFHMGLFQGLMAFLGWLGGSSIAGLIGAFDHWLALGLLTFVGVRMIKSGTGKSEETATVDPSRGSTLLLLCIATSIDAMAVGFSMAIIGASILWPSLVIGVVTLGLSLIGLLSGAFLGKKFGKRMEVIGGLILLGIGINIVITHLFQL